MNKTLTNIDLSLKKFPNLSKKSIFRFYQKKNIKIDFRIKNSDKFGHFVLKIRSLLAKVLFMLEMFCSLAPLKQSRNVPMLHVCPDYNHQIYLI